MDDQKSRYCLLTEVHPSRDPKTAYDDARAGRVPAFQMKPGGRWYVDRDEWDAHIARLKRGATVGGTQINVTSDGAAQTS